MSTNNHRLNTLEEKITSLEKTVDELARVLLHNQQAIINGIGLSDLHLMTLRTIISKRVDTGYDDKFREAALVFYFATPLLDYVCGFAASDAVVGETHTQVEHNDYVFGGT